MKKQRDKNYNESESITEEGSFKPTFNPTDVAIGRRIRLLRTRKLKIAQQEMAQILGTGQMWVSKWERGEQPINEHYLTKLADYARVSFDWLFTGEGVPEHALTMPDLISLLPPERQSDIFAIIELLVEREFARAEAEEEKASKDNYL